MILVTGATGHLGKAIVDHLLTKVSADSIAVLARDEGKAADLKAKGVVVREGNYHDKESLKNAFAGVEKAVLVSSSDFNDRLGQHKNVVQAAKDSGVKHLVYTSLNIADINASPLKDIMIDHFQTEDFIKETGLPFTILRNNLYADILPFYLGENVVETGIYFPAAGGKVPFALRAEMGEAAANVLSGDSHLNKTYNINSGVSYSFYDVAKDLSELSGKSISYTEAKPDEFVEVLKKAGTPDFIIPVVTGFAAAIAHNDFDLPSDDLETLIGRKPAALDTYLKATYIR